MRMKASFKPSQLFCWETEPKLERDIASVRTPVPLRSIDPAGPGPADSGTQTVWEGQRQPSNRRDLTLSSLATVWLIQFAPAQRPSNLCALYPRVANRLALCWPDTELKRRLLDSLLVDRRGKRQGFPGPVADELRSLRGSRQRTQDEARPLVPAVGIELTTFRLQGGCSTN